MCHVCKNREKNMLAFVLWLNIACNMLVSGEENEHCLHNFICWPVATHGHSTSMFRFPLASHISVYVHFFRFISWRIQGTYDIVSS